MSFLDAVSKQAGRAVSRAERQIELLSEYRTCLIADVVTGKLDVRGTAARFPDDAEELRTLDEDKAPNGG